ncbi:hypothetical protein GCM10010990_25580 [Croceicoccus mobilis]|uniref:HTH luxR-type domain-containing protein n=2 Tax=Croceicoccus mobilis TaxID=1703339 RepID=A0A916Z3X2_9SPHN|nr:hypothetical protein GCM10010990_25580 [Croceicoccus mobilis]
MRRSKAHIVDREPSRRASVARTFMNRGVHAEIYDGIDELRARPPEKGFVLAHQSEVEEQPSQLEQIIEIARAPVSVYSEDPILKKVVEAMLAGAIDYWKWPLSDTELEEALSNIEARGNKKGRQALKRTEARKAIATLSKRELQVLTGVFKGQTAKQISADLGSKVRTIEIQRATLYKKLNAQSASDAVRIAFLAGWGE